MNVNITPITSDQKTQHLLSGMERDIRYFVVLAACYVDEVELSPYLFDSYMMNVCNKVCSSNNKPIQDFFGLISKP